MTSTNNPHGIGAAMAGALIMAEFARRHVARGASWGRIINVSEDIANVGVWPASVQADWVCGQTIYVGDGHGM